MANGHMKRCSTSLIINANLNHNEISLHTHQNGYYYKDKKQALERMWRKGNPQTLLVGMQSGASTMENSMEIPQKINNTTTMKH